VLQGTQYLQVDAVAHGGCAIADKAALGASSPLRPQITAPDAMRRRLRISLSGRLQVDES
jgi:hypothetical protein